MARAKRSDRYFVDNDGNEVDRMEQATGAGYSLVSGDGSEIKSWELRTGLVAANTVTMHAVFGFWTKVGNVINTVVNDKNDPGTLEDAALAATEHVTNCENGIWREVSTEARGPKYDKDTLAGALLACLTADKLAKGDLATYRAKLDDKSYYAKVRAQTKVMAQYYSDLAAKGVAVDTGLGGIA